MFASFSQHKIEAMRFIWKGISFGWKQLNFHVMFIHRQTAAVYYELSGGIDNLNKQFACTLIFNKLIDYV